MKRTSGKQRGFTLLEMMISLGLGAMVTAAAVTLFSQGMDATWVTSQKAEMQQDLRAAENLLLKDISLAGSGLTNINGEDVPLPSALGSPTYGCSTAGCPPNGSVKYPCVGAPCSPTLYPIMPGFALGIKPPGSNTTTDLITVVYTDSNLAMNCYLTASFNATGNVITFTAPTAAQVSTCVLPSGLAYPQALNNSVNGLTPGDLILVGIGSNYAVGEVTAISGPAGNPVAGSSQYVVTFSNGDTLNMNQSGAANDLTLLSPKPGTGGTVTDMQANRLLVITYYLKNIPDPTGATTGTNILYRQINGQPAVPLVDNIANMQFTYDTYNTDGTLLNATGDGGESLGISPNEIRKVNILHLTIHSQLSGARSSLMATQGYQSFDVQTSISARNLSFSNRY